MLHIRIHNRSHCVCPRNRHQRWHGAADDVPLLRLLVHLLGELHHPHGAPGQDVKWVNAFLFENTILFWGELGFLISSDWRGIIKSEQTQTVRRIRAGTLFSQFQNIAYVASQNETFVVLLSSQIFSMTRHQTESFTCPGTRWLYFHLMPLILLTTHPTYRKMTRGGICRNRRSNNAEKVMLCII